MSLTLEVVNLPGTPRDGAVYVCQGSNAFTVPALLSVTLSVVYFPLHCCLAEPWSYRLHYYFSSEVLCIEWIPFKVYIYSVSCTVWIADTTWYMRTVLNRTHIVHRMFGPLPTFHRFFSIFLLTAVAAAVYPWNSSRRYWRSTCSATRSHLLPAV